MPIPSPSDNRAAAAEGDEWTFVKTRKIRGGGKKKGNRGGSSGGGGAQGGHRRPAPMGSQNFGNEDDERSVDPESEQGRDRLERTTRCLSKAMEGLRRHEYTAELLRTLLDVPSSLGPSVGGDDADISCRRSPAYGEIVCYGIGNFAAGSRFASACSAPLLQLALALVIREALAEAASETEDRWASQQAAVRTLYFEPLMTPVESKLLENFRVEVIAKNERGKRRIAASQSGGSTRTLFYMPHCPMRLYSNVLRENWDPSVLLGGDVVFLGNDFRAYDDRTLHATERADPTNAVLKIIPYLVSRRVGGLLSTDGGVHGSGDVLAKLESAFNDSVVQWFVERRSDATWPEQPSECVHVEGGEIL